MLSIVEALTPTFSSPFDPAAREQRDRVPCLPAGRLRVTKNTRVMLSTVEALTPSFSSPFDRAQGDKLFNAFFHRLTDDLKFVIIFG
ncbi:TPA: hypothetical protein DF272_06805 [Candidatus Falkowbacteria bacterium]|nr:hypothetical protein [Candidatus Falkowbacteria bacterium]